MASEAKTRLSALKSFIRHKYAWPGGYPMFAVLGDGGCLCHACAKGDYPIIAHSTYHGYRDGWEFSGVDINYEDAALYCDDCGQRIESAYAED